jgi:pimeloyl-ACP methyl ester carboxylesterase
MNDQPQPNTMKERASLQVPSFMRRTAQFTQLISTALSAKIAWRWFLTPYPFKIPDRERPMEERFGTPEQFTHPLGLTFPVYTLGTGPKHVLFVHGWGGRFTQFSALLDHCEDQNPHFLEEYTVIGFNALAHRGAQGKRTMMPEFGECIQQIQERYGKFHSIVSHSLGSNAALYAQMECGTTSDHQILIAPPGLISDMVGLFCDAVGFNTKVHSRIVTNLKKIHGEDFDNFSAPCLAARNTIPALVFHDLNDNDTPIAMGRSVGKNLRHGTFIETKGLGHRRILRDPEVLKQIYQFLFAA